MAHPAFWPTKSFFYPVGNTPPVCLTQSLPPEEDATILLLGCGDPRNILYTLYSNESDHPIGARRYDITCCDIEPAIVARNILLFTLVLDDGYTKFTSQIWNIFYHFFIDEASNMLLLTQCRKLATLSVDMETWNTSKYSSFLRVSSRLTLSELNRLWTLYAATGAFTAGQRKELRAKFVTGMKSVAKEYGHVLTGVRAAGPLHTEAYKLCPEAHHRYWQTGVTFEDQRDITSASLVNPTFAYTAKDDGFLPHYATCPLPAFPLAMAFAPLQSSQSPCRTIFDLFHIIKGQFLQWCDAFHRRCAKTSSSIVIRFLIGDVLATCHTLKAYADDGSLTAHERLTPWDASWLSLDGDYAHTTNCPPPRQFNIIDTSNLVDHIGLLNILIVTAPLLLRDSAATLLTETLLARGEDPLKSFTDRLCCDPNTLFILLDLVPSNYVSGFATLSNIHEVLQQTFVANDESPQYHERMVWKILSLAHGDQHVSPTTLRVEHTQLSGLLFDIYLRMFAHENMAQMFQNLMSVRHLRDRDSVPYSRRTFALFVRYVTSKIATERAQVLDRLLDLIGGSRQLLVGMNYYQDLLCHLHMIGLYTDESWLPDSSALLKNKGVGRFRHWSSIPSVVCLVMTIPRQNLEVLEDPHRAPNGPIQIQIFSDTFCNAFTFIQITFGTVSARGENEDAEVIIAEDARGKKGKSPAVVMCWVPAWLLCLNPVDTSIVFGLVSTVANAGLISKLGPEMKLYGSPLMDASKVHIVRRAPITLADENIHLRAPIGGSNKSPQLSTPPPDIGLTLDSTCGKVVSLTRHIDITEPNAQIALSKAETNVMVTPVDGSGVELSVGSVFKCRLYFPPVADKSKARLRVARKSSWVEVTMPVPGASLSALQDSHLTWRKGSVSSWNVHYINLDRLPSLRVDKIDRLRWLNTHVSLMLSDAERTRRDSGLSMTALSQVKDSIHTMMNTYAGTQSKRTDVFALNRKSKGGIDTLIFVTHLRLDLGAHTIILDAFVLPLEDRIVEILGSRLAMLSGSGTLVSVIVSEEELIVWKHLLPALTERCRTWQHRTDCAYVRQAEIPLSTEHGEIPICDCGRGIVTDTFKARKEWAVFAPFVTRIAISPLFALSYLESVGQFMTERWKKPGKDDKSDLSTENRVSEGGELLCTRCGKKPPKVKLSACSVCKTVNYCGRDCQVSDWKKHKAVCRRA